MIKAQPLIEYITCESGDWYVLKKFGVVVYEGHSVPDHVWLDLIKFLLDAYAHGGQDNVLIKEISDKDMEEGRY